MMFITQILIKHLKCCFFPLDGYILRRFSAYIYTGNRTTKGRDIEGTPRIPDLVLEYLGSVSLGVVMLTCTFAFITTRLH